ncbi:MAG: beta-lactamase family protein [Lewinellaceae bacterium]|nr:beta-lactamase family protein [Lewinellaceae bacterium]
MKKNIFLVWGVWALILIMGCNGKSDTVDINVEEEILAEMEARQIPSVAACVVKGGAIAWEGAFGFADVPAGKAATRSSLYNMESISKLFISVSVMQLWEGGLLQLDADINLYLPFAVRNPGFPEKEITPRMLLTHTSSLAWPKAEDGLPDFEYFFIPGEEPSISEWLPEYILPEGEHYRPTVWKDFPPGEQELYSNIGSSLLALMVEHITGMDYRDYCRENILEPLEMYDSGFRLSNLNEGLLVTPYWENNSPVYQFVYRHYPAGNLKSNIEDFSHFVIAILNYGEYNGKRILERATFDTMFEVHNPATGMALLWNHCLGDCIGKAGGGTGYSAWAEWHFQDDSALFIFSNRKNLPVYPGERIYDLVRYKCGRL